MSKTVMLPALTTYLIGNMMPRRKTAYGPLRKAATRHDPDRVATTTSHSSLLSCHVDAIDRDLKRDHRPSQRPKRPLKNG
jgi:hypothetical protein